MGLVEQPAPDDPRAAAWGLWVDLTTGLIPALGVGEIRDREIADEVLLALTAVELEADQWGAVGTEVRRKLHRASSHLRRGASVPALVLLLSAADRLYEFATD